MRRIALSFCVLIGLVALTCAWGPSGQRLFGEHCRTSVAAAASQYQTDPYAANLVARWDFVEGAGWLNDASANAQHFTIVANQATNKIVGTNQYGRVESAAYFDGTDDTVSRVLTTSDNSLWSNLNYTISAWAFRERISASEHVFSISQTNFTALGDGDLLRYSFESGEASNVSTGLMNRVYVYKSSKANSNTGGSLFGTNQWVHVAFTFQASGNVATFWFNGASNVSFSGVTGYSLTNFFARAAESNFFLSVSAGNTYFNRGDLKGYLDQERIYNARLPADGIAWLYANTHPTNCLEAR